MTSTWTPPTGTVGFDTSAPIDATQSAALFAAGYRFAIRMIGLESGASWALTAAEASLIRGAGLSLGVVQTYRNASFTADQGTTDGASAASQAQTIGVPQGVNLWCDVEGTYDVTASVLVAYLNNWAEAVTGAGYRPGLYNGPEALLSGAQVTDLAFQSYWQAGALVPQADRGYQLIQLYPPNTVVCGVDIDIDVAQEDFESGTSTFWAAAG
jgi:hypothetical protein